MKIKTMSKQEQYVLHYLFEGHKNKEIADIMGLNEKTVSTYIARIREKAKVPKKANLYKALILIDKWLAELEELMKIAKNKGL